MGRIYEGQKSIARTDDCYGYNTDGGCQRWNLSVCRQPGFTVELNRSYVVNYEQYNSKDPNLGMIDCKANCLASCRCVAYNTLYANWTGCRFFTTISNFSPSEKEMTDMVYILSPKPLSLVSLLLLYAMNNTQVSYFNISWLCHDMHSTYKEQT